MTLSYSLAPAERGGTAYKESCPGISEACMPTKRAQHYCRVHPHPCEPGCEFRQRSLQDARPVTWGRELTALRKGQRQGRALGQKGAQLLPRTSHSPQEAQRDLSLPSPAAVPSTEELGGTSCPVPERSSCLHTPPSPVRSCRPRTRTAAGITTSASPSGGSLP